MSKRKPKAPKYAPLEKLIRTANLLIKQIEADEREIEPMIKRIEVNKKTLSQYHASISNLKHMMEMRDD